MGSHSKKAVEQPVRRSHWSVHSWLLPPTPSPTSSPPLLIPSSHISGDVAAPDVSSLLAFAPLLKLSKMPLAHFFLCWGKGRKRGERGRGRKKERKKEESHFLPLWTTYSDWGFCFPGKPGSVFSLTTCSSSQTSSNSRAHYYDLKVLCTRLGLQSFNLSKEYFVLKVLHTYIDL